MKLIDENLLNNLTEEAVVNPRLRKNFNLHNSLDDKVQKLLNALEPGTVLPIHRHINTDEVYFMVRGSLIVKFYNEKKDLTKTQVLNPQTGQFGISIPAGQWHTIEVLEKGTIIFEVKEGPYLPLKDVDIL